MPDNPELCARCAENSGGCCGNARVFLTAGDLDRINKAGGSDDFWEEIAVEAYAQPLLDPAWAKIFRKNGNVRTIRHAPGGGCLFLDRNGCRLPLSVRPLVCRLYPFDYNSHTIKGVYGPLCPWPERANAPLLLALLGMNRERAETWRQMLYREIDEEFPDRARGKIRPPGHNPVS